MTDHPTVQELQKGIRVLNQMLAAENLIHVFPNLMKKVEFLVQALNDFPGIDECCVVIRNSERVFGNCCDIAIKVNNAMNQIPFEQNMFSLDVKFDSNISVFPLNTSKRFFGYVLAPILQENVFNNYKAAFINFINSIALHLESDWLNQKLIQHKDELEKIVNLRTAELQSEISLRQEKEEELIKQQQMLDATEEISRVGGWQYDVLRNHLTWTKEVYNIYGVDNSFNPININSAISFYVGNDQKIVEDAFYSAVNKGKGYDLELEFVSADNIHKWVHTIGKPIVEDGNVVRIIGNIMDISEAKQTKELLISNEKKLKDLLATKDKFFSIMAHDLRSPFSGLLGISDIMAKEIDTLSIKDLKEMASTLNDASNSTFKLLNELLEWSRMQSGTFNFNPIRVNIFNLIETELAILKIIANRKKIKLVNKLTSNFDLVCDKTMISTVIRNLLSNAIKFTPSGGSVEIGTKSIPSDAKIVIYVEDSGIGMNKEAINQLFHLDNNTTSVGTEGEKGTGLGLILCKEFIEKHNGKIWVESEEGNGSTFYLSIPKLLNETNN